MARRARRACCVPNSARRTRCLTRRLHHATSQPSSCQLPCREARTRPARAFSAEVSTVDTMVTDGTTGCRLATAHLAEHQGVHRRARRLANAACTAQDINDELGRRKRHQQVLAPPAASKCAPSRLVNGDARTCPSAATSSPPVCSRAEPSCPNRRFRGAHASSPRRTAWPMLARRRAPRLAVDLQPRRSSMHGQ